MVVVGDGHGDPSGHLGRAEEVLHALPDRLACLVAVVAGFRHRRREPWRPQPVVLVAVAVLAAVGQTRFRPVQQGRRRKEYIVS
ncbi:hypothetical protein RvVAT039_35440 [Agrobacterium vitis]|nr:hypothetical protein RvVAT039_35440 [Agrobacterium vitis]